MLNNIGVALLESGAFHPCLETLKDAIAFMKLVHPAVEMTCTTTSNVEAELQQALHKMRKQQRLQCQLRLSTAMRKSVEHALRSSERALVDARFPFAL
jgi:hypothetical protein